MKSTSIDVFFCLGQDYNEIPKKYNYEWYDSNFHTLWGLKTSLNSILTRSQSVNKSCPPKILLINCFGKYTIGFQPAGSDNFPLDYNPHDPEKTEGEKTKEIRSSNVKTFYTIDNFSEMKIVHFPRDCRWLKKKKKKKKEEKEEEDNSNTKENIIRGNDSESYGSSRCKNEGKKENKINNGNRNSTNFPNLCLDVYILIFGFLFPDLNSLNNLSYGESLGKMKDVFNCCAVSRSWYCTINSDSFLKRLVCEKKKADMLKYKKTRIKCEASQINQEKQILAHNNHSSCCACLDEKKIYFIKSLEIKKSEDFQTYFGKITKNSNGKKNKIGILEEKQKYEYFRTKKTKCLPGFEKSDLLFKYHLNYIQQKLEQSGLLEKIIDNSDKKSEENKFMFINYGKLYDLCDLIKWRIFIFFMMKEKYDFSDLLKICDNYLVGFGDSCFDCKTIEVKKIVRILKEMEKDKKEKIGKSNIMRENENSEDLIFNLRYQNSNKIESPSLGGMINHNSKENNHSPYKKLYEYCLKDKNCNYLESFLSILESEKECLTRTVSMYTCEKFSHEIWTVKMLIANLICDLTPIEWIISEIKGEKLIEFIDEVKSFWKNIQKKNGIREFYYERILNKKPKYVYICRMFDEYPEYMKKNSLEILYKLVNICDRVEVLRPFVVKMINLECINDEESKKKMKKFSLDILLKNDTYYGLWTLFTLGIELSKEEKEEVDFYVLSNVAKDPFFISVLYSVLFKNKTLLEKIFERILEYSKVPQDLEFTKKILKLTRLINKPPKQLPCVFPLKKKIEEETKKKIEISWKKMEKYLKEFIKKCKKAFLKENIISSLQNQPKNRCSY